MARKRSGPDDTELLTVAGVCGMVGPVIAFSCIILAMAITPDYTLTDRSLSSLAGSVGDRPILAATGAPAILFNLGLMAAGVMGAVFGFGLRRSPDLDNRVGHTASVLVILVGVLILLVGIFPLTIGLLHTVVSYTLFTISPVSMLAVGWALLRDGKHSKRPWGRAALLLGIIAASPFMVPWPFSGLAIPELVGFTPLAVFTVLFGSRTYLSAVRRLGHRVRTRKRDEEE